MFEIIFKIWFAIAILPFLIFLEGWEMFKKYMSKGNRWDNFPYFLLALLVILLLVLLLAGYQ